MLLNLLELSYCHFIYQLEVDSVSDTSTVTA